MVVVGFHPSQQTLIVRADVLLDPDERNIYHATTIWYSIHGYIWLGKFPVLPGNVHVTECDFVLKQYHIYLGGN